MIWQTGAAAEKRGTFIRKGAGTASAAALFYFPLLFAL